MAVIKQALKDVHEKGAIGKDARRFFLEDPNFKFWASLLDLDVHAVRKSIRFLLE